MAYTLKDAWALHGRGRFGRAVQVCDTLLRADPDNAAVLACRAMSDWSRGGDIEAALADMQRAVALAPDRGSLRHNLATVLASLGRHDEAQAAFRAALEIDPSDAQAFYGLAQNTRFAAEDAAVVHMREALDTDRLPSARREFAAFGLAKAYDDLGRAAEAFDHARLANSLGARPHDIAADRARYAKLAELAAANAFRGLPDSGLTDIAPVFIVGMPRSGTTLVEAILARHPAMVAGGELPFAPQIEQAIITRFGEADAALGQVPARQYRAWADKYVAGVREKAGQPTATFTDKLPHNALRLGLLARLFPAAKVIHVRRHPLDTGVSNYFMRFERGHGYSNALDLIGAHSRILAETVDLWRAATDLPVLDLRYEDIVGQPEPAIRRIVDFARLEWDPACLTPEAGAQGVMTASQWQVRQPINRRSVARWRTYEPWLEPMIAEMGGMGWVESYQAGPGGGT